MKTATLLAACVSLSACEELLTRKRCNAVSNDYDLSNISYDDGLAFTPIKLHEDLCKLIAGFPSNSDPYQYNCFHTALAGALSWTIEDSAARLFKMVNETKFLK